MPAHHCVVADLATRKNDFAIALLLHMKVTDESTLRRSIKSGLIDADISAKIRNCDDETFRLSEQHSRFPLSDHGNRLPLRGREVCSLLCSFILSVQITTSLPRVPFRGLFHGSSKLLNLKFFFRIFLLDYRQIMI